VNLPANPSDSQTAASIDLDGRTPRARAFALLGLVWQCALIYGIGRFVFLMAQTFIAITRSGSSDPKLMADGIGQALVPIIVWGSVGAFGLLVTVLTLAISHYRARWFFWSSAGFAVVYLLAFPMGTFLAIALIILLVAKRKEFFASRSNASVA
jgi:hypothetical protein